MIGWLLVLSFLLGFALTWLYMVRTISRTVEPVSVRSRRYPAEDVGEPYETNAPSETQRVEQPRGDGPTRVPSRRVVEFEDETDSFGR